MSFFHILFFYLLHIQEKKHLSALHCSAVFTVVVEELSWSARVSCSLFHLIGHGLPVAIASLFLCAYHSLSPVLSFHPSFLLNSLSLLSPSAFMPDLPAYFLTVSQERAGGWG